ncbi:MAG: DUF308 domain-containing protein [Paracoccaceae bacterium]
MNRLDHSPTRAARKPDPSVRLARIGIAFAAIGALAVILPAWGSLAAESMIASILALWGVAGMLFACEMRHTKERSYAGVAYGTTFVLGLVFLLLPGVGVDTLTTAMIAVFLMEGVASILLGLRLSGQTHQLGLDDPEWGLFVDRRLHHPVRLAGSGNLDLGPAVGHQLPVDRDRSHHAGKSSERHQLT